MTTALAPTKILFKLTPGHVVRGVPCQPHDCPVALALKDGGLFTASVGSCSTGYMHGDKFVNADISPQLQTWISKFDATMDKRSPLNAFTHELTLELDTVKRTLRAV